MIISVSELKKIILNQDQFVMKDHLEFAIKKNVSLIFNDDDISKILASSINCEKLKLLSNFGKYKRYELQISDYNKFISMIKAIHNHTLFNHLLRFLEIGDFPTSLLNHLRQWEKTKLLQYFRSTSSDLNRANILLEYFFNNNINSIRETLAIVKNSSYQQLLTQTENYIISILSTIAFSDNELIDFENIWDNLAKLENQSELSISETLYDICNKLRSYSTNDISNHLIKEIPVTFTIEHNQNNIEVYEPQGEDFYCLVKTSSKAEQLMDEILETELFYASFSLISHRNRSVYNQKKTKYGYILRDSRNIIHVFDGDSFTGMKPLLDCPNFYNVSTYAPKFISAEELIERTTEMQSFNELAILTPKQKGTIFKADYIIAYEEISEEDKEKCQKYNINKIILIKEKWYPQIVDNSDFFDDSKTLELRLAI